MLTFLNEFLPNGWKWFFLVIGIFAVVYVLILGYRTVAFGWMYEMTKKTRAETDGGTAKLVPVIWRFLIYCLAMILSLPWYCVNAKYRNRIGHNLVNWQLTVEQNRDWKRHFIDTLREDLRHLDDISKSELVLVLNRLLDESATIVATTSEIPAVVATDKDTRFQVDDTQPVTTIRRADMVKEDAPVDFERNIPMHIPDWLNARDDSDVGFLGGNDPLALDGPDNVLLADQTPETPQDVSATNVAPTALPVVSATKLIRSKPAPKTAKKTKKKETKPSRVELEQELKALKKKIAKKMPTKVAKKPQSKAPAKKKKTKKR